MATWHIWHVCTIYHMFCFYFYISIYIANIYILFKFTIGYIVFNTCVHLYFLFKMPLKNTPIIPLFSCQTSSSPTTICLPTHGALGTASSICTNPRSHPGVMKGYEGTRCLKIGAGGGPKKTCLYPFFLGVCAQKFQKFCGEKLRRNRWGFNENDLAPNASDNRFLFMDSLRKVVSLKQLS